MKVIAFIFMGSLFWSCAQILFVFIVSDDF